MAESRKISRLGKTPVERRAELAAARGKERVAVLLDNTDPEAAIRALPADELYFAIREAGLADGAQLVPFASAEQFRVLIDLDCWRHGEFDTSRVYPWLRAARIGADATPAAAIRWEQKIAELDPELVSLILRSALVVHDLEQNPDPPIPSEHFMRMPGEKQLVEFLVQGVDYLAVRRLVDDLLAADTFGTLRLLESVRWDFPSELSEMSLRWRSGRLADLGYPSLEEALSYYARPPKQAAGRAGTPPSRPPGFFLATFNKGTLLDQAAGRLPPDLREAFDLEMVTAANSVLVANAVEVDDVEAVRGAFESARALIEIGLEHLSGRSLEKAVGLLLATPVKRIFQHGFGRILELAWRAKRIMKLVGPEEVSPPSLDSPLAEMVAALSRRRPLYFPGIELPRSDWATPDAGAFEPRPFLSSAEISRTESALDILEQLVASKRV